MISMRSRAASGRFWIRFEGLRQVKNKNEMDIMSHQSYSKFVFRRFPFLSAKQVALQIGSKSAPKTMKNQLLKRSLFG